MREAAAWAAAAGGLSPRAMRKGLRSGPRRPPGALLPLPAGLLGRLTCGSRPSRDAAESTEPVEATLGPERGVTYTGNAYGIGNSCALSIYSASFTGTIRPSCSSERGMANTGVRL